MLPKLDLQHHLPNWQHTRKRVMVFRVAVVVNVARQHSEGCKLSTDFERDVLP